MNSFCLMAHPEYYDYMHTITFLDGFRVELFYGEGQGARYEDIGDYFISDTTLTITYPEHPGNDNIDNDGMLDDGKSGTIVYEFRKETGIYEWEDDLTGEKKSASERYIFDQDPCGVDDGQVIFYRI